MLLDGQVLLIDFGSQGYPLYREVKKVKRKRKKKRKANSFLLQYFRVNRELPDIANRERTYSLAIKVRS